MADFERGPRDLRSEESVLLLEALRSYRIPEDENFNPHMGTFPMADIWGFRSQDIDLRFERLLMFHKDLLGKDPTKLILGHSKQKGHEQDIFLQNIQGQRGQRLDISGCRIVDNLASGFVEISPVGLVKLTEASFNTRSVMRGSLYESAFLQAQQGTDPGIDPNTIFIEVHPDYVKTKRLLLVQFISPLVIENSRRLRPDLVLIDRQRNLVPRKIFSLRALLNNSSDNDFY